MVKQKSGCRQGNKKIEGQSVASRTVPGTFLGRVYQMVDDPSTDSIISWSQSGKSFIIWDPDEFSRDILNKTFKLYTDLSSFMNALKPYGFRKVDSSEHWETAVEDFVKGEPERVRSIYKTLIKKNMKKLMKRKNRKTLAALASLLFVSDHAVCFRPFSIGSVDRYGH